MGVTTKDYDQTRGKLNVVDQLMACLENVKKTGFADEVIIEESGQQRFRDIRKYQVFAGTGENVLCEKGHFFFML